MEQPATIQSLIAKIRVTNLVPSILDQEGGEEKLQKIAERVIEDRDADRESMKGWENFLKAGRQLQMQELQAKSEPWEGAANFKSPTLMEASLKFGDRATATLLKPRDLVKYDVIGPDKDEAKEKRGKRITTHMNFQLNYEMETWREDQDGMHYILPSDGAAFKYTYFDSGLGTNVSEVIRWPDFSVNQANTSMETCRSFTIDREFSKSVVIAKQREGVWHEYKDSEIGTEGQTEQKEESESDEKFFIQQMFYDLDEDGYEEPYMATVHEPTGKVLRLTARFEEDNIMVKTPNGKVVSLDDVLNGMDSLGFNVSGDKEKDRKNSRISQCSLVRINPINCITEYGFIPGDLAPFEKEGSFLGIGYFHILAGLTQAINSSSNTILNAGKLASTPGGFLAKGFRRAKGELKYAIGQFIPTLMSPQELSSSVKEFNWKGVDQAFYLFNEKMNAEVQRLAASADLSQAIGANAPATTMLGLIQEQLMPMSAITMRIYRSMKKEFAKLADLNRKYTDPVLYKELVGEEEGEEISYQNDYKVRGLLDVAPAANPEMTSKIQNLLQSMSVLEQADRILQYGGNPIPVMKKYLQNIGEENLQEIFPNDEKQSDPQLDALRQSQQREQEIAMRQTELYGKEVQLKGVDVKIKFLKARAEIKEILSKVVLNLEKAESEEVKNTINQYTAQVNGVLERIAFEERQIDREQSMEMQSASINGDAGPDRPEAGQTA